MKKLGVILLVLAPAAFLNTGLAHAQREKLGDCIQCGKAIYHTKDSNFQYAFCRHGYTCAACDGQNHEPNRNGETDPESASDDLGIPTVSLPDPEISEPLILPPWFIPPNLLWSDVFPTRQGSGPALSEPALGQQDAKTSAEEIAQSLFNTTSDGTQNYDRFKGSDDARENPSGKKSFIKRFP